MTKIEFTASSEDISDSEVKPLNLNIGSLESLFKKSDIARPVEPLPEDTSVTYEETRVYLNGY